jgi:arylsulfatase A-like enzyme
MLIQPGRPTVGTVLQDGGYHTAVIGKWHLGLDWARRDTTRPLYTGADVWQVTRTNIDYGRPVTRGPNDVGFDESFVLPSSLDIMPYLYVADHRAVEPADAYTEGLDPATAGRGRFWRPGEMAPGFRHEAVMDTFTDRAVSYLGERADAEVPFFLYLAFSAPHTPWLPMPPYAGSSGAGDYGDFVQQTDASVGRVLHALDSLGLADNTLVVFTSDNGADWRPDDQERFGHRANAGFRGRKADIWEAGHRVPFLVRWPGIVTPGRRSDAVTVHTDLMATVADILGRDLPHGAGEDSFSLLPLLRGDTEIVAGREAVVHHSLDGMFAIRRGDWKLILGRGSGGFTAPRRYDPAPGEPAGQLYNLADDPAETTNRYAEHPDLVADLTALLDQYRDTGRSR